MLRVKWINKQGKESQVHYARGDVTVDHVKYGEFPLLCGRQVPYRNEVQEIATTTINVTCQQCIGRMRASKLRLK